LFLVGAICAAIGATGTGALAAVDAAATRPLGGAARSGGTVVVGLGGTEPRTLNVLTIEGNAANGNYVLQPVVTSASKYNHRNILSHDLLEGVTVNSRSPLVVTYRIKLAAKWNDNRPVSAEDMIFTYQQIMNPSHPIVSRVGFEDIGRIQKVNAKTIRVTFKKVYASYESLWGRIYPAHAGGGIAGQDFNQAWRNGPPIANGPFRFVSWERGSEIVVQRNRNYWGKQALLDQIVFRFVLDTNTQFQAMRSGEVDIIAPDLQQQIAGIRKQSGITTQTSSQFTWEHVDFQLGAGGHPALKKKYVREAIVTAINRLQMRQVLFGEVAPNLPALDNAIYKHFQPEYVAHKYQPHGFSQRKAIELLRSNGCTGGPATPTAGNHDVYSCPGVGKLEFGFHSTAATSNVSWQLKSCRRSCAASASRSTST
jgi:peptide/nickel transport system substrate-binding protein